MMLRSLSLFSGCLGLDLGMRRAGIRPLACVDKDPVCRETIRLNEPQVPVFEDVFGEDVLDFLSGTPLDLVVGGPPCQSFSNMGKRRYLEDERGRALLGFVQAVERLRPRGFIMENVPGIQKAWDPASGSVVRQVAERFEGAGYQVVSGVLDASDFGSPQKRKRFIMLGTLDGTPVLPAPCRVRVTLGDAIRDLEEYPGDCTSFSPKVARFMSMIPEGGCWTSLSPRARAEAMGKTNLASGGHRGFYRRLAYDGLCPTLVTSPTQKATLLGHPRQNRPLSVQEYQRIQGFPDAWVLSGTLAQRYRQLGNAVPVPFAEALGRAMVKMLGRRVASRQAQYAA